MKNKTLIPTTILVLALSLSSQLVFSQIIIDTGDFNNTITDRVTIEQDGSAILSVEKYIYKEPFNNPYVWDENTLFLVHFNDNLISAELENPEVVRNIENDDFVEGKFDKALYFNSQEWDVLAYGSRENLDITIGTLEMWIQPNWFPNDGVRRFFFFHEPYTWRDKISFYYWGGNYIYAGTSDFGDRVPGGTLHEINLAGDISDWKPGEWHHLALTWAPNGDNFRLLFFVDGILVDFTDEGYMPDEMAQRFTIGHMYHKNHIEPGRWADAAIDEVRISNIERNWGPQYTTNGVLISQPIDLGDNLGLESLNWSADTGKGTEIKFQVRTSVSLSELNNSPWVGAENDNFITYQGQKVSNSAKCGKYAQYKAYLTTTENTETPVLKSVSFWTANKLDNISTRCLVLPHSLHHKFPSHLVRIYINIPNNIDLSKVEPQDVLLNGTIPAVSINKKNHKQLKCYFNKEQILSLLPIGKQEITVSLPVSLCSNLYASGSIIVFGKNDKCPNYTKNDIEDID